MSRLHNRLGQLTRRTERELTGLWRRRVDGALSEAAFITAGGIVLARARAQGVVLADLTVTALLSRHLGRAVRPTGIQLDLATEVDVGRDSINTVLSKAVATATTAEELARSRALRLARLGRDAPASAMSWGMGEVMVEQGIDGWVREVGPSPCPLCIELADGVVRKPTVHMARHTGCGCVQSPVLR